MSISGNWKEKMWSKWVVRKSWGGLGNKSIMCVVQQIGYPWEYPRVMHGHLDKLWRKGRTLVCSILSCDGKRSVFEQKVLLVFTCTVCLNVLMKSSTAQMCCGDQGITFENSGRVDGVQCWDNVPTCDESKKSVTARKNGSGLKQQVC